MSLSKLIRGVEKTTKLLKIVNAAQKGRLPQHLMNKEIARIKARATRNLWVR